MLIESNEPPWQSGPNSWQQGGTGLIAGMQQQQQQRDDYDFNHYGFQPANNQAAAQTNQFQYDNCGWTQTGATETTHDQQINSMQPWSGMLCGVEEIGTTRNTIKVARATNLSQKQRKELNAAVWRI